MLKINFLGDSITEGIAASEPCKCYVELIAKLLDCEVRNYGISGTRIARQQKPSSNPLFDKYFASRASQMKNDADLVFIFGGTNDYGHGDAPLGKIDDKTPDTFCGALNNLVDELLKFYKKEQIKFVLPLYRVNEDDPNGEPGGTLCRGSLSVFREAMSEVLKQRNIAVFDIKDEIGRAENNPLLADGLHPNDLGHKKIAELIADFIKEKHLMKELSDNFTGEIAEPSTHFSYEKDGNILIFKYKAYDSSLNSYSNKNNDPIYKGDVVELFLDIGEDSYYEFEVAPNGTTFVATIKDLKPTFIKNDFFKSEVRIDGNNYYVKMIIDLSKFDSIKFIKFNAFRIETKGVKSEYILQALNPTLCKSFHKREKFIEFDYK